MIISSILILITGIIFHRHNFLILFILLELIYLLLAILFISLQLDLFLLFILTFTTSETAIGLSILLGYYLNIS